MKYLLIAVTLGAIGCSLPHCLDSDGLCIARPVEYEDEAVARLCNAPSGVSIDVEWRGRRAFVTKHIVTRERLHELCPTTNTGCVFRSTGEIYLVKGGNCTRTGAHELSHLFGVPMLEKDN